MDQALKQRWVEALRSGKYQQTADRLRTEEGFCCLGVLCDLVNPNGWRIDENSDEFDHEVASSTDLPRIASNGPITSEDPEKILATMNDGGANFGEIAAWIETNL